MNKRKYLLIAATLFGLLFLTGCSVKDGDLHEATGFVSKFIALPLANFIKLIMENIGDFGFAIILVVLIIRGITWPIYTGMNTMTMKMQIANPEIQRINAKYAGKTDPESKQRMQMEIMGVYKKYKVNFMGCLAPFIQFPVFIGTYGAIKNFAQTFPELSEKMKFFTIDLTGIAKDGNVVAWVIMIVMLVLNVLQLWVSQQKPKELQGKKYENPQNAQMQSNMKFFMVMMVVMMAMFAYGAPSALPFYWIIGSIFTIAQSLINRATMMKRMEKMRNSYN